MYNNLNNDFIEENQLHKTINNCQNFLKIHQFMSYQDILNCMPRVSDILKKKLIIKMIENECINVVNNKIDCINQHQKYTGRFYIACKQDNPFKTENEFFYYGQININKKEVEKIAKTIGHAYCFEIPASTWQNAEKYIEKTKPNN